MPLLMLTADVTVSVVVLTIKIAMKLVMLPRSETLRMCLGMFFIQLVVDVVMDIIEPVVLGIMRAGIVTVIGVREYSSG